jgi:crotonobetainyl-CoA:carnitine CoA-transferase CaiB-like acyl-CoA transferase
MLDGLKVLDLTWILGGPFAGQLLAQMGADVIKVEPPAGDGGRTLGRHEAAMGEESGFFLSANRGKRSVALDLKAEDGLRAFLALVRRCDAVVYGFAPGVPQRLKIDPPALQAVNSRIGVAQLIGFHDQPPYADAPAFDLVVQAMGGVMSITGDPDRPPARVGYQIADLAGGLYLALACAGVLIKGLRTGQGAHTQVSLLDCQLALLTWQAQNYLLNGRESQRLGGRHPVIAPNDIFRCLDGGYMAVSPTGPEFWRSFCRAIGNEAMADDPRFATPALRAENVQALTEALAAVIGQRTTAEWTEAFFRARVPAGPVHSVAQAVEQPLAQLRGMVETAVHPPTGEPVRMLGNPFKHAGAQPLRYPPGLGEHTREVLMEVGGYSAAQVDDLLQRGIARAR